MERTLILLKPCTVQRRLIGEIINRIERKGLRIIGMKMMQLNEAILNEHYAHLADKPFFPTLKNAMMAAPVIAICAEGTEAVTVMRTITGATNGRKAAPGTIRGDYGMSGQENIVHASDSVENAEIEIRRFFKPEEIFEYPDPLCLLSPHTNKKTQKACALSHAFWLCENLVPIIYSAGASSSLSSSFFTGRKREKFTLP